MHSIGNRIRRGHRRGMDNGIGLDIGPELEEDTVTPRPNELMLEHEGKTRTLGEEITLGS